MYIVPPNLRAFPATREMADWFSHRTLKHISLVQKYIQRIADLNIEGVDNTLLIEEGQHHDEGKFLPPELIPYIHLTWQYKQRREGSDYIFDPILEEYVIDASFHHITTHEHHPEYWDDKSDLEVLNSSNRDLPSRTPVDATSMPPVFICTMIADWLAIAEELGDNPFSWAFKNIGVRWQFTEEQKLLIFYLLNKVNVDRGGTNDNKE